MRFFNVFSIVIFKEKIRFAISYLQYLIRAKTAHGIHSPFVFDFIQNVLKRKYNTDLFEKIEKQRSALLSNHNYIQINDLGAGSRIFKSNKRVISSVAQTALKPKKYAILLHNIISHYQPKTALELGTSFGITSLYQALANENMQYYTFEGCAETLAIAESNFKIWENNQIQTVLGNFDKTLPKFLKKQSSIDYAFIDGNHDFEPTKHYFNLLKNKANNNSIFIFDDIHWSSAMERAWHDIIADEQVTCSIDLFHVGLVFFNPAFGQKSHFTIRY